MIKMADVARELGVSKATVSLAVNNKPGVREETRRMILNKIRELRQKENEPDHADNTGLKVLKVIVINHHKNTVYDPQMDLWTDTLHMLDTETGAMGYAFSISYYSEEEEEKEKILTECSKDYIAGVIVFATEADDSDLAFFNQIEKPLILYDYEDPDRKHSSVCIDHNLIFRYIFGYLKKRGIDDVLYFSTGKNIYNFEKRREAFLSDKNGLKEKDIICLGESIPEIAENARVYFEEHELPGAMIFENYQISMGVISTLSHLRKGLLGETEMIGIDEIPAYIYQNNAMSFSFIRIPHADRAKIAVDFLTTEIEKRQKSKIHIEVAPEFVSGKHL